VRLPGRPAGTVSAEFAGVLDGRALWLAVSLAQLDEASTAGWRFAVRPESGEPITLGGELDRDHLAVIADLPTAPGTYDVLVACDGDVRPVVAEEPSPGPTRTPDQGPVRYELAYADDGLRVTVSSLTETAGVVDLSTDGSVITVTLTDQAEPSGHSELVFVQDHVDLGSVPLVPGPRGRTATLTADNVPGSNMRLVVPSGGRRKQVRRIRNGLTAAGPSVLLPRLEDDAGEPVLVCMWHPDSGNLRLRRPQADTVSEAVPATGARSGEEPDPA
jgi:hypothetical protein